MFTDKSAWYLLKKISYGHKFAKRSNMTGNMSMHLTFKLAYYLEERFYPKRRKGGKLDLQWNGPYIVDTYQGKGLFRLRSVTAPHYVVTRINGAHLKHYIQIPKL